MRRVDFTLSTCVPVRVALPVARVAVRRVQVTRIVRAAAPAPLAGIAPGVARTRSISRSPTRVTIVISGRLDNKVSIVFGNTSTRFKRFVQTTDTVVRGLRFSVCLACLPRCVSF